MKQVREKRGIITIKSLRDGILDDEGLKVSKTQMKNILIKDLKLKWKKVKNNECYVNTKKNKILRFIFAKKIIEVMK